MSGKGKTQLVNELNKLTDELTNPLVHISHWIKLELLNLNQLISAIDEKNKCTKRKQDAIKRLTKDRDTSNKLTQGQFTF